MSNSRSRLAMPLSETSNSATECGTEANLTLPSRAIPGLRPVTFIFRCGRSSAHRDRGAKGRFSLRLKEATSAVKATRVNRPKSPVRVTGGRCLAPGERRHWVDPVPDGQTNDPFRRFSVTQRLHLERLFLPHLGHSWTTAGPSRLGGQRPFPISRPGMPMRVIAVIQLPEAISPDTGPIQRCCW